MGMPFDEDDEEEKDNVLGMLGGEVDDYAGKQIPGPEAKGVTIAITVTPNGAEKPEAEEKPEDELSESGGGNDAIAHILGACGGGCAMCKGGVA